MPGFKSRWMIPIAWRCLMPDRSALTTVDASSSVKLIAVYLLLFISCLRVPPATNYMIRYRHRSVSRNEWNRTIFWWRIDSSISAYFLKQSSFLFVKWLFWKTCMLSLIPWQHRLGYFEGYSTRRQFQRNLSQAWFWPRSQSPPQYALLNNH